MITKQLVDDFISRHRLPDKFHRLVDEHYGPLIPWLLSRRQSERSVLLGINGAPGTGKSTLAGFLKLVLEKDEGWNVAVLSIDDFYLTRSERRRLSKEIHPLLKTRGVPGTHDLRLLTTCIEQLRNLDSDGELSLPRFDKARDDRAPVESWPVVTGSIDLIILEGWCVGSEPQEPGTLAQPINELESNLDPTGTWRRFVNKRLEKEYARLFTKLNFLFFLRAPDFEVVYRWRLEQEEKLAADSGDGAVGLMGPLELADFMQHYERLTRENFIALPKIADIVFELNDDHDCERSLYSCRQL